MSTNNSPSTSEAKPLDGDKILEVQRLLGQPIWESLLLLAAQDYAQHHARPQRPWAEGGELFALKAEQLLSIVWDGRP